MNDVSSTERDPAADDTGAALMIDPRAYVEEISATSAVICHPDPPVRLQLRRSAYELYLRFVRPRWVDDELPADPSARIAAESLLRQLQRKGVLVPPALIFRRTVSIK